MKKDRKSTTPLIAAHSANKNNHKPASPVKETKTIARVSNIPKQTTKKIKSLTLDRISEGIIAFDHDLNCTYVNERAGKLLGCKPKDLIGKNLRNRYRDANKPPFADACQRAIETQTVVDFNEYFAPTDAWLEGRAYPSEDGISVLFTDEMSPKEQETENRRREDRYRTLFDTMQEGFLLAEVINDQNGQPVDYRLLEANASMARFLGKSREELVSHTARELFTLDEYDMDVLKRASQVAVGGEPFFVEKYASAVNRWFRLHVFSPRHGQFANLLADITESKRAEEKILDISKFPGQNPNPVMRFTQNGKLLYANDAAEPLLAFWKRQHGRNVPAELEELLSSFIHDTNMEIELEGEGKIFSCLLVPIHDSGYVNLYFRDITGRKQAEESLRALINQTTAGITRTDMEGRLTFVNQAFCEMLGYPESELIGKPIWEISHPDDIAKDKRLFDRMRIEGEPYQMEKRLIRKNDTTLWVSVGTSPLRDASGKTYSSVSMLADITRRKRAEESLLETARRTLYLSSLSDTIRHLSDPLQIQIEATHALGIHLKASRVAYMEIDPDETIHIPYNYMDSVENNIGEFPLSDCIPAELLPKLRLGRAVVAPDLQDDFQFNETQKLAHDAAAIHSQIVVPLIKGDQLIAALCVQQSQTRIWNHDEINLVEETAERMQTAIERAFTERKLRESENRFRILSNTVPSMVWATAPDGRVLYLNDHWYRYTGLSPEKSISNWAELSLQPDDYESYVASWKHALATVPDEYVQEVRYRRYDGEYRWFQSRATPARDESGKVTAWYGVSTDIHDRVEKQDELLQIINQTPFMLTRCSRDLRYRFVSRAYAEMIGRTVEEVAGMPIVEIMGAEGLETIFPHVEQVLQGRRVEYEAEVPFEGVGAPSLHVVYMPDYDEQGEVIGWFASITDVTDRKRYEQSLIEYARRQTALYTLTDQLHRASTLDDVFNASLDAILNALQCQRASILLFDETKLMHFVAWRGLSDDYRKATDGHSPWQYGEENPAPIFSNDITTAELSDSLKTVIAGEGIRSLGFIPLLFQGRLIGKFMVYFNTSHVFSESELSLSQTIARQLASGVDRKRKEEALRQSEERFSRFMEYLPGLAWIKDRQGRYVFANAAAEKAFNTQQAQLYGRTDEEIFPTEIASQFKLNDEQAMLEGRGVQVVETLPQEDGTLHHSLVTKFPIPGPGGETALIGGTAFDITERKEMEDELLASRQRLAATYEYSPIGLVEYSTEGRFLKVNEEICRILGYERDELLKLTMKDVTYEEDYVAEEVLYRQLVNGEIQSYKIEKRFKRKDGSLVWTQKIRSCVHNSTGKLLYTIGAIVDISERKRAESRLALLAAVSEITRNIEEPDELMSSVADTVGAHLQVKRCLFNEIDLENDIEVVHRDYHDGIESVEGVHKIRDYSNIPTAEMVAGKTVVNHDSKTDPRTAHDYERSYAPNGERAYVAIPLMRDDHWVASLWVSTDTPRQWSKNEVSLLQTIAERTWTATEKLRITAALRDSEERLRVTFNTTAVGFATLELDTRFVEVNDAFCNIVGYSREELLAMNCDNLTHPDYVEDTKEHITQLIAGEIPSFVLEKLYIRRDGTQIWVQNSVSLLRDADGHPLNLITICQDVTERKNTEDQLHKLNLELEERVQRRTAELQSANVFLRESEATSRLILESVPDAIVITNAEGVVVHCNTQVESLFGYSPNDLLGQPVEVLIPKRFHQHHLFHRQAYGEEPSRRMTAADRQLFAQRRNGDEFPVEITLSPISNSTTWDAIITIRDNTEQRQAQELLRVSEEKLRTLFEILPVGISFLDQHAKIIEMNSALAQILGLSKQELLQGAFSKRKYIRSNGSPMPRTEFASVRALTEQKTVYNVETGIIKENGETIWTNVNAAPVKVADVEAVVVTVDITERKNAEEALHKNRERLRILSRRLVEVQEEERRAIARELHDRVGQNLAALNLNLNILRSQLSDDALTKVGTRLSDSVQLVNDILTITRSVMADLRSNVLDDYGLESALREYADQFSERFGIRVVPDRTQNPIPRLDPSIEMTLLRIAQEALTNVARHAQASQVTITLNVESDTVHMTIQDNGIGILSWQKANQPGSHGLRIIRERTEAFGGSMQIQSAYKKGTTIEVKIPIESGNQPRVPREKRS